MPPDVELVPEKPPGPSRPGLASLRARAPWAFRWETGLALIVVIIGVAHGEGGRLRTALHAELGQQ